MNVGIWLFAAVTLPDKPDYDSKQLLSKGLARLHRSALPYNMKKSRIEHEKTVVSRMIEIYCRNHHGSPKGMLCDECSALLDYALARLDRCPKGNHKSSCRKCEIHCYSPAHREAIRRVMRYSGPRMLLHYPLTALRHLLQ